MLQKILAAIGLILGMCGCFFTIRKVMFDVYLTKELFYGYKGNQELFRWIDKLIHKIGSIIFKRYLIKQSKLPNNVRILREGNEVVIGFILILLGFLSQLSTILISLSRKF